MTTSTSNPRRRSPCTTACGRRESARMELRLVSISRLGKRRIESHPSERRIDHDLRDRVDDLDAARGPDGENRDAATSDQ